MHLKIIPIELLFSVWSFSGVLIRPCCSSANYNRLIETCLRLSDEPVGGNNTWFIWYPTEVPILPWLDQSQKITDFCWKFSVQVKKVDLSKFQCWFSMSVFFSVKNIRLGEQLVLKHLYFRIRPYFWGLMLKSNQKSIWPTQLAKICILLALQHSASKVCSCYSICVKSCNSMQWEITPCTYYHRFLGLSKVRIFWQGHKIRKKSST